MAHRRFNWKFALVLLLGTLVLATTAVLLRNWRRGYRTEQALARGLQAYDAGQWPEAADNLGRFLNRVPEDVPILLKYAQANLNIRPVKRGAVQQALAAYRNIFRIDPRQVEATDKLVNMYLHMNAPSEAEFIARKALEHQDRPELHVSLAAALAEQRQFSAADARLRALIEEHPEHLPAYEKIAELAQLYPDRFLARSAQEWLELAVAGNPDNPTAFLALADHQLQQNQREDALANLQQARDLNPTDDATLLRLARTEINARLWSQARQTLDAVEQLDHEDLDLWTVRARLARLSGDRQAMLQLARTGPDLLSSRKWDFLPLAVELCVQAEDYDLATEYIAQLRSAEINLPEMTFYEGLIADRRNQPYQAIRFWNLAQQEGCRLPQLQTCLAATYYRVGDLRAALQQLRSLVNREPDSPNARLALGQMLLQAGQHAEAAQQAQITLSINPQNIDAAILNARARVLLLSAGNADNAAWNSLHEELELLREIEPENETVALLTVEALLAAGRLDQADQSLDRLEYLDPDSLPLALLRVRLLQAQDRAPQAREMLRDLIEKHPTAVEPVRLLVFELAPDDLEQCRSLLRQAMDRITDAPQQRELCLTLAWLDDRYGRSEQTLAILETFVQEHPEDVPVRRVLVHRYRQAQRLAHAQALVDQMKAIEGDRSLTWSLEQARLWLDSPDFTRNYTQAIALLKDNLRVNPHDQASRLLLAAAYRRAGENQLATAIYQQAYERDASDLAVIVPYVAVLNQTRRYDEADRVLREASRKNLAHPSLQQLQLQSLLGRDQVDASTTLVENLLHETPENPDYLLLLASLNIRRRQYDQADRMLDELDRIRPDYLPTLSQRIELLLAQGLRDQALALCNDLIDRQHTPYAFLLRARLYAQFNEATEAFADLDRLLQIADDDAQVCLRAGELYQALGHAAGAARCARHASRTRPDDPRVQVAALDLMLNSGDREILAHARELLDRALRERPNDPTLRLQQSRILLALDTQPSREQARRILQEINSDQPSLADAWLLRGQMALQQREPGRAVDLALQGLAYCPNDKQLLLLKAGAEAVRSPELAAATLRICRDSDPTDTNVLLRLADAYNLAEQPEHAIRLLEPELDKATGQTRSQIEIALAASRYRAGERSQAIAQLERLAADLPRHDSPLLTLARLLQDDQLWNDLQRRALAWARQSPRDQAAAAQAALALAADPHPDARNVAQALMRQVLESDPQNQRCRLALAELLYQQGRIEESRDLYQRILAADPENVVVLNNLAWILCEHFQQYDRALELARLGLALEPDYVDLIDTRGMIHLRLGQLSQASADFNRCIELHPAESPGRAGSFFHLARVWTQLGQPARAVKNFNLALAAHQRNPGLTPAQIDEALNVRDQLMEGVNQ